MFRKLPPINIVLVETESSISEEISSLISRIHSLENLLKLSEHQKSDMGVSPSEERLKSTHQKCTAILAQQNRRMTVIEGTSRKTSFADASYHLLPISQSMTQAEMVIDELIETERAYLQDMVIFLEVFVKPMWAQQLLPGRDLELFGRHEEITSLIDFHGRLLDALCQEPTVQGICQGMNALVEQIRELYASLLQRQKDAFAILVKYTDQNSFRCPFSRWLNVAQTDERCRKLYFRDFLIKPLQRLCRYPLLLKELAKRIPPSDADGQMLHATQLLLDGFVEYCNTQSRLVEKKQAIMAISTKFEGLGIELVAPGRLLIGQGKLKLQSRPNAPKKRVQVFLFSDIIVFAFKKSTKKYIFHRVIPLNTMMINCLPDNTCAFEILIHTDSEVEGATTLTKNGMERLLIMAQSKSKKNWWIEQISRTSSKYE